MSTTGPQLFNASDPETRKQIAELERAGLIAEVVDPFDELLEDLFRIRLPFVAPGSPEFSRTFELFKKEYANGKQLDQCGVWCYFPWRKTLVHLTGSEDFYQLQTARNKFLVEPEEQERLRKARVGIAGMSIGSSILNALVLSGGCRLRLADFDTLSVTNLNRLLGSVCELGKSKLTNASRRAWEHNPFLDITPFSEGLTEESVDAFFGEGSDALDVFVEETDGIRMKIISRFKARERGIPVIMATDNGDNTILDIERFDLEPDRPLFHGKVDEELLRGVNADLPLADKVRLANSIVGPDVTPRMQRSLTMVGTALPAWPQLGTAATLSGAAVAYVTRRIITGKPMPSGRYEVHFDELLDPEYATPSARSERERKKQEFIDGFNLLYEERS